MVPWAIVLSLVGPFGCESADASDDPSARVFVRLVRADEVKLSSQVLTPIARPATMQASLDGRDYRVDVKVRITRAEPLTYAIVAKVQRDGHEVGEPALLLVAGEQGRVDFRPKNDFVDWSLVVSIEPAL